MTPAQIADELVRHAPSGKVAVKGLGVFHARDRRRYRRGIGVLLVLAPHMRAVLAGGDADDLEGLAADVAAAVRENRVLSIPVLGTFRAVVTTKKNLIQRDGSTRVMKPRPAIAFEPSAELKSRLSAATRE
ncbi:MAG TPA: hypothetical protein VMV18_11150 [bacterium]|nr:hypothetical protein [bacterium]